MRAGVLTVSDRVARGERTDESGPLAVALLAALGFDVPVADVVSDDSAEITAALLRVVASGVDLVITTGGTGFGPRDNTPEATAVVLDRPAPGLAELVRAAGQPQVMTSALSRAVAGARGRTLVINLAGSPGAVRDGLAVLAPLLPHAVSQLHGNDH